MNLAFKKENCVLFVLKIHIQNYLHALLVVHKLVKIIKLKILNLLLLVFFVQNVLIMQIYLKIMLVWIFIVVNITSNFVNLVLIIIHK